MIALEEISRRLEALEAARQEARRAERKRLLLAGGVVVSALVLGTVLFFASAIVGARLSEGDPLVTAAVTLAVEAIVFIGFFRYAYQILRAKMPELPAYKRGYRQTVEIPLLEAALPGWQRQEERGLSDEEVKAGSLFLRHWTRSESRGRMEKAGAVLAPLRLWRQGSEGQVHGFAGVYGWLPRQGLVSQAVLFIDEKYLGSGVRAGRLVRVGQEEARFGSRWQVVIPQDGAMPELSAAMVEKICSLPPDVWVAIAPEGVAIAIENDRRLPLEDEDASSVDPVRLQQEAAMLARMGEALEAFHE